MEKHELNFFPEAGDEDQKVLREDIQNCGFDKRFPILTFEGKILDGWNRFKASEKAGVKPVFEEFTGTHKEALEYSIRANLPRRNLSSSQRAAMAVKSSEIWDKISLETEKNKKEKISNSMIGNDNASKNQLGKKVSQTDLSGDKAR